MLGLKKDIATLIQDERLGDRSFLVLKVIIVELYFKQVGNFSKLCYNLIKN